jgi:hypothetical protein
LIEANSLVELRLQPERLTDEIAAFLEELWAPPRAKRGTGARSGARRSERSSARPKAARAPRAKRPRSTRRAS